MAAMPASPLTPIGPPMPARRDFTINAIYLDPDGTVHDPVGGLADLEARRVRFVGDPALRIAEDVLRILRYYRFEARFGTGEGNPPARAACHAAAQLLPTLSAERVTQELVKLLDGASPVAALRMMAEDGVLAVVLPEARRIDRLAQLIALDPEPDPPLRLAALIEADAAAAAALARRLRLPNAWRERLAGLAPPWPLEPGADWPAQRHALYRLGAARYRELALLTAAAGATTAARLAELLDFASRAPAPVFPLTGRDVTALGVPPGERVGRLLGELRRWWEDGDFAADRTQCLARLKELADVGRGPELGRALARMRGRGRGHRRHDRVRAGEGEIFGGVFGRQDLDHRMVLDPHLDDVERAAAAVMALPALAVRDRLDRGGVGGDAEREMDRAEAGCRLRMPGKAGADGAARLERETGRMDLDAGAVLVELEREKAPRIGRKPDRGPAHQLGQDIRDMLRIARRDGQMMDHGALTNLPAGA